MGSMPTPCVVCYSEVQHRLAPQRQSYHKKNYVEAVALKADEAAGCVPCAHIANRQEHLRYVCAARREISLLPNDVIGRADTHEPVVYVRHRTDGKDRSS